MFVLFYSEMFCKEEGWEKKVEYTKKFENKMFMKIVWPC
jgi:hypothetical protein